LAGKTREGAIINEKDVVMVSDENQ